MTSDGDIEISSPASEAWVIFFLYIIVIAVVLFISTIFYIQRYMGKGLCIKDNTTKKQVDDQVKAGNEIESDKDSRVLFDVASESLKKKLPPTDEFQYCYEGQSNANEKGKGESGRNCNDIKERELPTDETDLNDEKEKPAGSITGSYHDLQQLENEEDMEESTDIFDDTFESLQQIPPEIGEKDKITYTELYNLLGTDGLKLSQEVMAAIIFKKTGKSTKTLIDQEKNKLIEVLSEEHLRILESENECGTSFHVSYGLHQIYLDEAQSPKSGWGIPVKGKDKGIGDDVERLNRIQTIYSKISNPETLSVENYIRLLDIMVKALIGLDSDAQFEQRLESLDLEIARYKKTYFI